MDLLELKDTVTEIQYSLRELSTDQIQENRSAGQQKITRLKYKEKRKMENTEQRSGDIGDIGNFNIYVEEKEGEWD